MNLIKVIICCAIAFLTTAFSSHDAIYPQIVGWDTYYKATPDLNSPYAAVTNTIWRYGYTATITGNHLHIDFNFTGGVDVNTSWVNHQKIRNKKASSALLNHEQGHVYINFILLKKGETVLKNQAYTTRNYKNLIESTAKDMSRFYDNMHERYDLETKHGADLVAQKNWDGFFSEELESSTMQ